ncbi:hypothetical protein N7488_003201 [Penicillium malachiteum]|nr:hypothetical protein N7488_003201 [Penicillium malachiteum]
MADEDKPPHDPTKFKDFHVHDVKYKEVHGSPIFLSILVPEVPAAEGAGLTERRPLITTFHGGTHGKHTLMYIIKTYNIHILRNTKKKIILRLLELSISQRAPLVLPDYRLLPESTGIDILSDIDSFWLWLSENLEFHLTALYPDLNLRPDLDRILLTGDSAGGFCVMQSLLRHSELNIKAAIAAYPMVDFHHRYWSEAYEKPIFGAATVPTILIYNHLKSLPPNAVFSGNEDPATGAGMARMPVALSIVQNGKFIDFLGREPELYPIDLLPNSKLPPFLWVFHGRQDSAVPFEQSEYFVKELEKHVPDTVVRFDTPDGEHGFDGNFKLADPWIQEGMTEILSHW